MSLFKWSDKYSVNVKIIDNQHKHFIGLIDELYECLVANDVEKFHEILNDLKIYTNYHFETEEKYFDEFNYKDSKIHKAAHQQLREKTESFLQKPDNLLDSGYKLLEFMTDWLVHHIEEMDKKYSETFHKHGLS